METKSAKAAPSMGNARLLLRTFALLILPVWVHAQAPTNETVTGIVTNEAGRPVAGAKVGTAFRLGPSFANTQIIIRWDQPPVVTDASGTFAIDAATIRYTKVLVAADENGTMGFVVRSADKPIVIRLKRPAVLKIDLSKDFGSRTPVSFDLINADSAVGYGAMSPGSAQFIVPAGTVELRAHDVESRANVTQLSLAASKTRSVDVHLQPTAWAQNVGKPAPDFTPTDVQNMRAGTSLQTLRGKWVLVEFWAKWCVPCIKDMPKLMEFYEQHADLHDRFEIVAIHSPDGASLAAIRNDYDSLVERAWAGKPLPFPLVFDASGETQRRWGIEAYPTHLLIDPQGKVVGLATVEELAKKLGL